MWVNKKVIIFGLLSFFAHFEPFYIWNHKSYVKSVWKIQSWNFIRKVWRYQISDDINRRTVNTMAKWKSPNGQTMICKTLHRKLNDFTRALESKDTHGEVYLMQHYVIKFVSYLWKVFTTSGTYPWSFVTHIFHSDQPSHGGDRKTFEVMTST